MEASDVFIRVKDAIAPAERSAQSLKLAHTGAFKER